MPQLYSTVDASAVDWEDEDGQITVRLTKLDPSLRWPQLEVAERGVEQRMAESPLQDREQVKALLSAAQCGDVEAFKAAGRLFPAGQLDAIKDANGRTALHFAAASSNAELCQYLAREEGFPLDATDESGVHALSKRSRIVCHLGVLAGLIHIGGARSLAGETPLALAAGAGDLSCMHVLLEAGANPTLSDHGAPQPMHRAASSGDMGSAQPCNMSVWWLLREAYLDGCT